MSDQNKPYRPDLDTSWKPTRWTPTSSGPKDSAPNDGVPATEVLSHEGGAAPATEVLGVPASGGVPATEVLSYEGGAAPATEVLGAPVPGGVPATEVLDVSAPDTADTGMAPSAAPTEVLSEVSSSASSMNVPATEVLAADNPNAVPATQVLGAQASQAIPATEVLTEIPAASTPQDAAPTEVFPASPSQMTPVIPATSVLPEVPAPTPQPQNAPAVQQVTSWTVPAAPAPQQVTPHTPTPPVGSPVAPSNPYAAPPQGFTAGAPTPQPFHASPSAPTPAPFATNAGGGAPYSSGPTPGAPMAAPTPTPYGSAFGSNTGPGAPYSSHGAYAPPSVGSPATARRSKAPLIIGLFTVGIAALLVVIFFVIRAIAAIGGAEWGAPGSPGSESDDTEYVQPGRGSVNPYATEGMGQGKYEVPTDPWLHSGYAAGVSTWNASGQYIGVSKDKEIIAFYDSEDRRIVGHDVKTGAEKWRISLDKSIYIVCDNAWNGVAYCYDTIVDANSSTVVFISIDLAKGEMIQADDTGVEGDGGRFIGYWQGYTFWTVSSLGSYSSGDALPTHNLIALKDGKKQWEVEVAANASCLVGDGGLGCYQYQSDGNARAELINASTGEIVAEYAGDIHPHWHRDGYIISDRESENTEYRRYSWAGEDMGTISPLGISAQPGERAGNLLPIDGVTESGDLGFVDPSGKSLLSRELDGGEFAYTDLSTKKALSTDSNILQVTGDQKGTVYIFSAHDPDKFSILDENGKEILSEKYGEDESINSDHGILFKRGPSNSITVYAPKG
ncbi:MAG: hypothetical protein Q4C87_01455 [Actinomycetaceae bacterium]|nr:hypothetical protein [Actinomycetaceae bacterium]